VLPEIGGSSLRVLGGQPALRGESAKAFAVLIFF